MHRIKNAATVVESINKYKNKELADYELISIVCDYFDKSKEQELSQADLKFLKYISNIVGIPHYYDLLESGFGKSVDIADFNLNTFSSVFYESTLHLSEEIKVHKYQKEILNKFQKDRQNRFFLSASTSFGKTHLVYDIIKKMEYKNVVLIFPTIALLSENLEKIIATSDYAYFKENFSIHTLSEVKDLGDRNLFIYTPERFLSYTDKNDTNFDFAFIDEIYKLDNAFLIDEVAKENERDVAYRLATYQVLSRTKDILLAGPYIEFFKQDSIDYNDSFDVFMRKNEFELIDYNHYEIVNKTHTDIKTAKEVNIDDKLRIDFGSLNNKKGRFIKVIESILNIDENSIVYCSDRAKTESYAREIIKSDILLNHNNSSYFSFLEHIRLNYNEEWVLYKALKYGVGIHHGLIPKYIQKEVINLFNSRALKVLLSTTTITEGVNTSAKNLIVLHHKKGTKVLKGFDAKNISGRAGRFLKHYSGRVIILKNDFVKILNSEGDGIKHKNYDKNSKKDEIDLFYTDVEFLNNDDIKMKDEIVGEQNRRNMPKELFEQYKVVSRKDKIQIYDNIKLLTPCKLSEIDKCIQKIHSHVAIDWEGFQFILDVISPIVKNSNLLRLITVQENQSNLSSFVFILHHYLKDGFKGSIYYKINEKRLSPDEAIKQTSDFVYNILKYHAVKYLGVFNIMYKYVMADDQLDKMDEIIGIEKLLVKMEYNALTDNGRRVSDYGVPAKVLEYYETLDKPAKAIKIKNDFDSYEKLAFDRVQKILSS